MFDVFDTIIHMISMIKVKCDFCKKSFGKELRYHKRSIKRGVKVSFCGKSCAGKYQIFKNPLLIENLNKGRDLDEFSCVRRQLISARSRSKKKGLECSITLKLLIDLWESQEGRCALSGIKIILPVKVADQKKSPFSASLDRIDSNKGYVPGNIQWVCLIGQYAKNSFSEKDLLIFCEAVSRK